MSNFPSLRYIISFLAILTCLFLPLTVEWIPNDSSLLSYQTTNQFANDSAYIVKQLSNSGDLLKRVDDADSGQNYLANTYENGGNDYDGDDEGGFEHQGSAFDLSARRRRQSVLKSPKKSLSNKNKSSLSRISDTELSSILDDDLRRTCDGKTNSSSSSIAFYYFELHVLLFHLAILSCSSFIQLYFYYKLAMMLIAVVIYIVGFNMHKVYECLAESMHMSKGVLPLLRAEIIISLFFYVIFLHLIDRRVNSNLFFLLLQ